MTDSIERDPYLTVVTDSEAKARDFADTKVWRVDDMGAASVAARAQCGDEARRFRVWIVDPASVEEPRGDNYSKRQRATILAALRFWQIQRVADIPGTHMQIASDNYAFEPLSDEEIDALCMHVNTEGVQV